MICSTTRQYKCMCEEWNMELNPKSVCSDCRPEYKLAMLKIQAEAHYEWCGKRTDFVSPYHKCFTCLGYNQLTGKPEGHCNG